MEKNVLKMFKRGKTEKVWADIWDMFFLECMVGEAEKYPTKSVTFHILHRS